MKPSEQYKHILHHAYSTATTFDHSYWVGQEVVRKGLKGDIVEWQIRQGEQAVMLATPEQGFTLEGYEFYRAFLKIRK